MTERIKHAMQFIRLYRKLRQGSLDAAISYLKKSRRLTDEEILTACVSLTLQTA